MLPTRHLRTCCALILLSPTSLASDTKPAALPLGVVLDDKGQPIAIPTQANGALNYTPPAIKTNTQPRKASYSKPTNKPIKKAKPKSRKQQLASRQTIANDPGCRWLNSRMSALEKHLRLGVNHRNQHQQQELNIRQSEWQCLKCGAEGPAPSDHNRCQHRR
ncbi:hypothetical protein [Shewanella youngdeokensis]|uniref:Uncharacterized protein n=1 Tax=Shewanella youngdeokensis TaxID=2999068 RepID=A0ABZ0K0K4_9GAMM|nr:hypothetical protein RGE70_00670 [Shewanella sp. DAU334]